MRIFLDHPSHFPFKLRNIPSAASCARYGYAIIIACTEVCLTDDQTGKHQGARVSRLALSVYPVPKVPHKPTHLARPKLRAWEALVYQQWEGELSAWFETPGVLVLQPEAHVSTEAQSERGWSQSDLRLIGSTRIAWCATHLPYTVYSSDHERQLPP